MKRHTNKHITLFGLIISVLTVFGVAGASSVNAETTKTEEVELQFTLNPTLNLTVSSQEMKISDLMPGNAKDSNEITVTVTSNVVGGYYLAATAGTSSTDTKLKSGASAIESLDTTANLNNMTEAGSNTWGFRYAVGESALTNSKYNGLPKDGGDNGATGTKLTTTQDPAKTETVKCQVGVKVDSTLPPGTYQNVVNFYAVSNK